MRSRTELFLTFLAIVAGITAAELAWRSVFCRDLLGQIIGRGHLVALVNGRGIYETDVGRLAQADAYLAGNKEIAGETRADLIDRLIAAESLRVRATHEAVPGAQVERQFDLLRAQFPDDRGWEIALQKSGLSPQDLRATVTRQMRELRWIEKQIGGGSVSDEAASRQYFAAHPANFALPRRLRASHLFLAAPVETPEDVVTSKEQLIDSLAEQLRNGADFSSLVAQYSEDEATKNRGGDLDYYSAWRTPPKFFVATSALQVGETSPVFRSALGFHIARLTDVQPARAMTFPEVQSNIRLSLANQTRQEAVGNLIGALTRRAVRVAH